MSGLNFEKIIAYRPLQPLLATLILALLFAGSPADRGQAAPVILYRINAGGPLIAATDGGPDWQEDSWTNPSSYHNEGNYTHGTTGGTLDASVPATTPPAIFDTERWDPPDGAEMTWTFPLGSPGTYEVRLYLKNGYAGTSNPGERIFSIEVEGNAYPELTDIDLVADYGNQVAVMEAVMVTSDTSLEITFLHNVQNPLVNGIEIIQVESEGYLAVAPLAHNFGQVEVGTSLTQAITLENRGATTAIAVDPMALSGDFQVAFPGATLAPGQATSFDVTFTPSGLGEQIASLDLVHDGTNSPVTVGVRGEGAYITASPISFTASGLKGESINNPTSLQFGPDGRLYVSQQDGTIYAYTVNRNGDTDYQVVATEQINLIKTGTPNHDDDGSLNPTQQRQVTGILVAGSATNPVLYVNSSDWRISVGVDVGLDTNSGVISRLTWIGTGIDDPQGYWDKVDIVRGLPRSEENHSTNGMSLDPATNTLYVMQGGNTNKGAPSNSFSGTPEYFFSSALLAVDLNAIESLPVYADARTGTHFVYDLPTLDDPQRANIDSSNAAFPYPAGHPLYASAVDPGDPFGGNNGLNMAIPEPGGPVQIYSPGYRNAYDVVLTENGRLYTFDNGPNGNWGGMPLIYDSSGTLKGYEMQAGVDFDASAGDYCTNELNEGGSATHGDPLRLIAGPSYYAGHPTPIRAFPGKAGIYIYEDVKGKWTEQGVYNFGDLLPAGLTLADFPDNPIECDHASNQNYIDILPASTNGIAEYTATFFGGAMKGNILAASYDGNIYRYALNAAGDGYVDKEALFGGFGSTPLDVTTQGDSEIFPGTVWAATYGSDNITVFEPADSAACSGTYSAALDEDGDGYTNADELDSSTDPCSGGSRPADNDGDFISDLKDTDDDNDGILDPADPFATDPANGTATNLPITYPFWNNDPGTGFFGLGFTGLMSNGVDDYLDLYDSTNMAAGGAAGMISVESVPAGTALGAANTQAYAFQFGFNAHSGTLPFAVNAQLEAPFFDGLTPQDSQAHGIYIGTGDQDNYLQIAVVANGGAGGIQVILEADGSVTHATTYGPATVGDLLNAGEIDFYVVVEPAAGTAQPQFSVDGGATIVDVGPPLALPAGWLDPGDGRGVAAGLIATSAGSGVPFGATWDFIDVYLLDPTSDSEGTLTVTPYGGINASTYSAGSLSVTNNSASGQQLASVEIDLSTGFIPDMVFDPNGTAGDVVAKCLSADSGVSATGFVAPADPCLDPFSGPHDNGFDVLTLNFADFDPGETFSFSVDADPTSIQGTSAPGPGESGSVSGLELTGARATFIFEDGSSQTLSLYRQPGSNSGGSNVARVEPPPAPALTVVGLASTPAKVAAAGQTIRVTGTPGAEISLLHVEAAFFQQAGGAFDPDPYEANSVILVSEYGGTLGGGGTLDIPVTLTDSDPQGGLNYLVAVVREADGRTGDLSNVIILDYDSSYQPPQEDVLYRVNAGGPELAAADGSTPAWAEDQAVSAANGTASTGIPSPYVNAGLNGDTTYGTGQPVAVLASVADSVPPALFQTHRYDAATLPEMEWDFPVAGWEQVEVRLYLAEIFGGIGGAGQRVFDVAVEGSVPATFTGVDLYAQNGLYVGAVYTTTTVVGADGNLDLTFLRGVENPAVNGIEIVSLGQADNLPPVIEPLADQTVHEGDMLAVPIVASDPDFDPLTLTATIVDGGGNPAPFDPIVTEGELYATPPVGSAGTYTATVTADDGRGGTASQSFALTVTVPAANQVIYRINVGGPPVAAADGSGFAWSADSDAAPSPYRTNGDGTFTAAHWAAHPGPIDTGHHSLPGGTPPAIFERARFDAGSNGNPLADEMQWAFPVTPGVEVEVRLYLAELDALVNGPGQRVFDVAVEGSVPPAFAAIDPYALAGAKGGLMLATRVTPTDAELRLDFVHGVGDPSIQGIEVVQAPAGPVNPAPTIALVDDLALLAGATETVTTTIADAAGETLTITVNSTPDASHFATPIITETAAGHYTLALILAPLAGDAGSYRFHIHADDGTNTPTGERFALRVDMPDENPPAIYLLGPDPQVQEVFGAYVEAGATAFDDRDGDLSDLIVVDATAVQMDLLGEYPVTYDVADGSGNAAATVVRTVVVTDTSTPLLTLLGDNPLALTIGDPYVELGATAADNFDGDLTATIAVDATAVQTDTAGTYLVRYTVGDGSGNVSTAVRTVEVAAGTAQGEGLTVTSLAPKGHARDRFGLTRTFRLSSSSVTITSPAGWESMPTPAPTIIDQSTTVISSCLWVGWNAEILERHARRSTSWQ